MMKQKISVLIDMMGYGIVELHLGYSFYLCRKSGKDRIVVECNVEDIDTGKHSWLCAKDFGMDFFDFDLDKAYSVCFTGIEVAINLYYQIMLNVLSDRLALKEGFFYDHIKQHELAYHSRVHIE